MSDKKKGGKRSFDPMALQRVLQPYLNKTVKPLRQKRTKLHETLSREFSKGIFHRLMNGAEDESSDDD